MPDLTIRRARPGDGRALADLHRDIAAYYARTAPADFDEPEQEGLGEILERDLQNAEPHALQLVAELDGSVVATVAARVLAPAADASHDMLRDARELRLRIECLATRHDHRRSGLASRLVNDAEAWGREHGATVAETTTYLGSALSMPFWTQRMSYQQRSVNLRKPLTRSAS